MTKAGIPAIPTRYGGVLFRSRLESKWACFFDLLDWHWSYEPVDFKNRIPDFVMHFQHPTIIECKPAFEFGELATHRKQMITVGANWLCGGAEGELLANDASGDGDGDLDRIDNLVEIISAVRDHGENPRVPGRRVLVGGSRLFIDAQDNARIDEDHRFARCGGGHVSLFARGIDEWCLTCGSMENEHLPSSKILGMWLEAGNTTRWEPFK